MAQYPLKLVYILVASFTGVAIAAPEQAEAVDSQAREAIGYIKGCQKKKELSDDLVQWSTKVLSSDRDPPLSDTHLEAIHIVFCEASKDNKAMTDDVRKSFLTQLVLRDEPPRRTQIEVIESLSKRKTDTTNPTNQRLALNMVLEAPIIRRPQIDSIDLLLQNTSIDDDQMAFDEFRRVLDNSNLTYKDYGRRYAGFIRQKRDAKRAAEAVTDGMEELKQFNMPDLGKIWDVQKRIAGRLDKGEYGFFPEPAPKVPVEALNSGDNTPSKATGAGQ